MMTLDHDPKIEMCIPVSCDTDLVVARRKGRVLAEQNGFTASEATLIATAISEVARNILTYAGSGEVVLFLITRGECSGITIVARDKGPGIENLKLAMQEGYSTSGGFGLGLPGVRRIVDEFDIQSEPGQGTTVTLVKWSS